MNEIVRPGRRTGRHATRQEVADLLRTVADPLKVVAPIAQPAAGDSSADVVKRLYWFTLVALNVARPVGASAAAVGAVLRSVHRAADETFTDALLGDLVGIGLATRQGDARGSARYSLTPSGVRVVQYDAEAPPTIGRPAI